MKQCPTCGTENLDTARFCVKCGAPLQSAPVKPRETVTEHLSFAYKTATSNLKLFVPYIAVYVIGIIVAFAIFATVGVNYAMGGMDPSMISNFAMTFLVVFVLMCIVGILSVPFLQDLYLSAVKGEEISFNKSLRYAVNRFISYLGAELLVFIVMIIICGVLLITMPQDVFINYPDVDYVQFAIRSLWLLLLVPFGVIYYYALTIMTWEDTGLGTSLRLSYEFIKARLSKLVAMWVILFVINIILARIPLAALISFVPDVIINLAVIDIYLNYKNTPQPETPETPETPEPA